ncbi:MAG: hypothetical protein ACRCUS_04690, partial [Anaerovoracaceae bacterium]
DTFLEYTDSKTDKSKEVTIKGTVITDMVAGKDWLYGFGHKWESRNTEIHIIDKDSLKTDKIIDLNSEYGFGGSAFYEDKLFFSAYHEESGKNFLCTYNPKTDKLQFQKFNNDPESSSNIILFKEKLYISHGSLVDGIGNTITVYNLKNKKMKTIKLKHNLSQIDIKNGYLYAIEVDAEPGEPETLYKYQIKDDQVKLICSADVYTHKNDSTYFYVGSFFVK